MDGAVDRSVEWSQLRSVTQSYTVGNALLMQSAFALSAKSFASLQKEAAHEGLANFLLCVQ